MDARQLLLLTMLSSMGFVSKGMWITPWS
uniref:Uncharacterized protein n=1 Tax=Arundo donax TaxID=35708 RepID=A0A0A9B0J2_ARUDO